MIIQTELVNLMMKYPIAKSVLAKKAGVGTATVYRALEGGSILDSNAKKILGVFNSAPFPSKRKIAKKKDIQRSKSLNVSKIEEMLIKKGWNIPGKFFSEEMGLGDRYWDNIVHNSNNISRNTLFGLALYLGCDKEDLFENIVEQEGGLMEKPEEKINISMLLGLLKSNNLMLQRIIEEFDIK